jgi:hypothetical protein
MVGHRTEWGIVMKTALLASLLTIGLGTALATTTDELMISSGGLTATITDAITVATVNTTCVNTAGSPCYDSIANPTGILGDGSPAAGTTTALGDINGWVIKVTTGDSYSPGVVPDGIDLSSLTATCTAGAACASGSANQLVIEYSDIGFNAANANLLNQFSATINGSGTASQSAYFANCAHMPCPSNYLFDEVTQIGSTITLSATGSGTSSGGPTGVLYSLTLEQVFTDATGGSVSFSVDGSVSSVPEPMSLLLLGGCLLIVGRKLAARLA